MKTQITPEMVKGIAAEMAFCESCHHDAVKAGITSSADYWRIKLLGIKEACRTLLGHWPASYAVESVEKPYVVVSFECLDAESEFCFDANTFELIR